MCGAGGGGGGGGGILPTSIIAVQGAVVHAAGLGWGFLGNFLLFPPPPPLSGIQLNIDCNTV